LTSPSLCIGGVAHLTAQAGRRRGARPVTRGAADAYKAYVGCNYVAQYLRASRAWGGPA